MGEESESRSGSEAGGEASTSRRDESADAVKYPVLQFAPWQSAVDEGFWRRLADLKLDILGIAQTPIEITGFYAPCSHEQVSNHMQLLFESLPPDPGGETSISGNRNRCPIPGILYNTNTLDTFNALDRQALFKLEVEKIWEDIHSGRVEEDSRLLCRFLVISFADLKNWSFYYWFGFPALVLNPPAMLSDIRPASEIFSGEEGASLLVACNEWRSSTQTAGMPFFLVHMVSNGHVRVRPLIEWESCRHGGGKVFLVFYDPCHLPNNPGWPLRNFLAFAAARWGLDRVKVICYREKRGLADLQQCLVADILLSIPKDWRNRERVPEALGWERNSRGKMGPRCINLAMSMDPHRLAISAADLNVKLIRWRAVPSLNLALLSATKCLLLGAGTLGCQVARGLMAWGFRQITLVDSGRVAMSNPLRQSLYSFEDCLNGGRLKAVAAAESLKRIFPGIEAEGISMTIPMPGHPVEDNEIPVVMKDCACLKSLIDSHDVIFLLTDTRESRWLPTLLCADANKVAITAALGFDSYLVMRHGAGVALPCDSEASAECNVEASPFEMDERVDEKQRLGCYFCNDVVAPVDSTVNRTLDQQCTVTRPGLAPIAAALAVELTVAILHHPLGITAPACEATSDSPSSIDQPLGILPHQIRGHLALFSMSLLKGNSFNRCTACCEMVVSEFRERGMDFVLQAINEPTYLEDLTGLTELMRLARSFNLDWEDSSEVDDECENLDLQHMNI